MSRIIVAATFLFYVLPALAQAPTPSTKPAPLPVVKVEAKPVAPVAATQPASQPVAVPGAQIPQTADQAIDAGKSLWDAVKAKKWWFAIGIGIYLLLAGLGAFGLFKLIGTFWAWIAVAVLSLLAGAFMAFGEKGFSWQTFLGYATAGPTVAYLRDFGKDVLLAKFKEWWAARKAAK